MKVDPSGLVSAAQRITAALADLAGGDPVHPPLGADPASVGGAARLSAAGSTLAAALAQQAAGLAATAEQLQTVATGFAATDEANAAKISSLNPLGGTPQVTGWAPPSVPPPPDVRPPLGPPPTLPGEAIAAAVHSGDPNVGEPFITTWARVAAAAEEAAGVVRTIAAHLPATWDSPISTPVVRAHLMRYAAALDTSAARANTLVEQANRHVEQAVQARSDIPTPQTFTAVNNQLRVLGVANAQSGGAYAVRLAELNARKAELDARAAQGYGAYHMATDATTAGDADPADGSAGDAGSDPAGADPDLAGADAPGAAVPPEAAGELAGQLPGMLPSVLGAAGGLVGGALATVGRVPAALMQAGSQAASAATQGLSGLSSPKPHDGSGDPGKGQPVGDVPGEAGEGDTGGADTTPAAGGPTSPLLPVMPSTGGSPTPPTVPPGGPPDPAQPAGAASGVVPMGMPLGGMMPGGRGTGAKDGPTRPKTLVVPPTPHTESVTGKMSPDRIAVSTTSPKPPDPPGDDQAPRGPAPIVRRITTARPRDEE
ncbi:PPE domain-containing protein [Mycobacterium branderi]|uniref:PPE domain-containing protein n=1 Tax=Mycobacterium branderi TaxID=43348 RepID=A0A7I7WBS6_9MYCO|nr:PPE domain-containing protein [Mycobacterium branderi]MCV7235282.1 PPE domain-containing protein [Mycobacterium branderi]ORA29878.1 hypothetical protein BST20_27910 [Mycobacterium branderi]BBZ15056.1 hypothetical protein MBRA_52510 [Mycobacterium branderi]